MSASDALLDPIIAWAQRRPDIEALILVGSRVGDGAPSHSDYDLVFLVDEPSYYIGREEWIHEFGALRQLKDEQWGRVSTRRAFYQQGHEIEFNFATPAWAALPLDTGTRQVLAGGYRILLDRRGQLDRRFRQALQGNEPGKSRPNGPQSPKI